MPTRKIAVITGHHSFEVQPFHQLFRGMPGIDAYIQHTDEFASEPEEVRDSYDAVVFYAMVQQPISDDVPWYAGKPKTAYEHLGETKQGILLLHHALMSYQDWPVWDAITGMQSRYLTSYHPNQTVRVEVVDSQHPIVQGMEPWEMVDETYVMERAVMPDTLPGNHILLSTAHAKSMPILGWTRQYKQSRVFCLASGHGPATYANPSFQSVLRNAIHWATEK